MINNCWTNAVQSAEALPIVHCRTDHELPVAKSDVRVEVKKIAHSMRRDQLNIPEEFMAQTNNEFTTLQ